MSDRYCGKCGVQTATDEMEFEIGTAMGVSQESKIEELNSLSECYSCREIRIYESVRREMDAENGNDEGAPPEQDREPVSPRESCSWEQSFVEATNGLTVRDRRPRRHVRE